MKKLSIIITAYNAEKTIERCINSILNQSYDDYEVIIIDDGSKDRTYAICEEIAKRNARISLYHQENGGVAAARNAALSFVSGRYVTFFDSDDYVDYEFCNLMVSTIEKEHVELAICNYYKNEAVILSNVGAGNYSREDFSMKLCERPKDFYYGVLWNKLYITEIIQDNNIRFSSDVRLGEDFIFNLQYLKCARNIFVLDNALYHYCEDNEFSLTKKERAIEQRILDRTSMYSAYCNYMREVGLYRKHKKQIQAYMVETAYNEISVIWMNKQEYNFRQKNKHVKYVLDSCLKKNEISFLVYWFSKSKYLIKILMSEIKHKIIG